MFEGDWEQTKVILREIETLFNREDVLSEIKTVQKLHKEYESQCENEIMDARKIIKQLADEVSQKEREIAMNTEEEHQLRLRHINQEREGVMSGIRQSEKEMDGQQQILNQLRSFSSSLEEQTKLHQLDQKKVESRALLQTSLYATISNIQWSPNSDNTKILDGWITNRSTNNATHIHIDTTNANPVTVSDNLWQLISHASCDD